MNWDDRTQAETPVTLKTVIERLNQGGWRITGGRATKKSSGDVPPALRHKVVEADVIAAECIGDVLTIRTDTGLDLRLTVTGSIQRESWWMQVLKDYDVPENKAGGGVQSVRRQQPALTLQNHAQACVAAQARHAARQERVRKQQAEEIVAREVRRQELQGTLNALYRGRTIDAVLVTEAGQMLMQVSDGRVLEVRDGIVDGHQLSDYTKVEG